MNRLLIVDGNAILHRAYHAIPALNTGTGEPINAVHGMVSMLLRLVDGLKPTHIVFAFDRSEPTFRKKEFENYQSQRPPTEDNLSSQFEKAKEVLRVMNIPYYDKAGYEADDVIGTLAKEAMEDIKIQRYKDIKKKSKKALDISIFQYLDFPKFDEVVIVTGDKDQLQLVNEKVKLFMPVSGISTGKLFG
jgi:DNA polymerase-1